MAEKNFAITPSVEINRSKFLRTSKHATSFNLGDIVPIYVDEVLPGDTRSFDFGALVRMSTPIAPIMDDIELELFAFYVPNRLLWKHWKDFMGENTSGAGYSSTVYQVPTVNENITLGSIGDYMGLPYLTSNHTLAVSELPLRAYALIYNRWFRNQNVTAPVVCLLGDDSQTVQGNNALYYSLSPFVACKKADYFTKALPYAQKGLPVSLPLGNYAPLKVASNPDTGTGLWNLGGDLRFTDGSTVANSYSSLNHQRTTVNSTTGKVFIPSNSEASGTYSSPSFVNYTNLVADLSNATAATINQIREAFQIQKALEKDALYGSRYFEILYGHFGIRAPDATLQDPEYLGGHRIKINVDQVLQTSETSTTALGTTGANSVTGGRGSLFTKSFCEHGWLMVMAVARQSKHSYTQGLNRMWSRLDKYDFYWPVFANLGAQEIKNKELFADINTSNQNAVFGYQEAWADYRYKPSIVTGLLRPGATGALGYWTLADDYLTMPTLSDSFVKESRANLSRALVTGSTGPDFIADFYFQDTAVRPMPLYSIPGLLDHH